MKKRKVGEVTTEKELLGREMMEIVARHYTEIKRNFEAFTYKNMHQFHKGIFDAEELMNTTTEACYRAISKNGIIIRGERTKSFLNYFYWSLKQNIVCYNDNLNTKKKVESMWLQDEFDGYELSEYEYSARTESLLQQDSDLINVVSDIFSWVGENFSNRDYQVFQSFYQNFFGNAPKQNKTELSKALKINIKSYNEALERTTAAVKAEFEEEFRDLLKRKTEE